MTIAKQGFVKDVEGNRILASATIDRVEEFDTVPPMFRTCDGCLIGRWMGYQKPEQTTKEANDQVLQELVGRGIAEKFQAIREDQVTVHVPTSKWQIECLLLGTSQFGETCDVLLLSSGEFNAMLVYDRGQRDGKFFIVEELEPIARLGGVNIKRQPLDGQKIQKTTIAKPSGNRPKRLVPGNNDDWLE